MAQIPVYNLKNEEVGTVDLADHVFATEVNEALLYDVVRSQLASRRRGTHKVKCRAEVAATGRKMYRQKGTGRARHGDAKAPQFRGGGRAFGPKPRDYGWRPPKKMRQGALRSALSLKHREGRLVVLDGFELTQIKTRELVDTLQALEVPKSAVVVDVPNPNLRLSIRNLQLFQFLPPEGVNVYDILRHEHLIATKAAIEALEERCS